MQDAIDAGTYEPSDAMVFAKYADRPAVIDTVIADNYGTNHDLDWRLQRAVADVDAAEQRQQLLGECAQAGWAVYEGTTRPATTAAPNRCTPSGSTPSSVRASRAT